MPNRRHVSPNLIRLIKAMRWTDLYLEGDIVSGTVHLKVENVPLPSSGYEVIESEPSVGSWERELLDNMVTFDNDITKRNWMTSLGGHEEFEKWVFFVFFNDMSIKQAYPYIHGCAEYCEEKWHVPKYGRQSWKDYSKQVDFVWQKEREAWNRRFS